MIANVSKGTPHSPLAEALLDLCRRGGMKLTVEALVTSGDEVMSALTGALPPEDPAARGALARWIVAMVLRQTVALGDTRDGGIAQAALPMDPALYGKNVDERVKHFVKLGKFTKHEYWAHRRRVADEIATGLVLEYPKFDAQPPPAPRIGAIPAIFLAGHHPDDSMNPAAVALGIVLDQLPLPVNVCSMASKVVMTAGYAFAEQAHPVAQQAHIGSPYTPERYTLYRRIGSRRSEPISGKFGRIDRLPGSLNEARVTILQRSDLMVVLSGDSGTDYETQLADQLGKPVVPIAATGGAALRYYGRLIGSIHPAIAADYHDLANPDLDIAVRAAGRVVTRLLLDRAA